MAFHDAWSMPPPWHDPPAMLPGLHWPICMAGVTRWRGGGPGNRGTFCSSLWLSLLSLMQNCPAASSRTILIRGNRPKWFMPTFYFYYRERGCRKCKWYHVRRFRCTLFFHFVTFSFKQCRGMLRTKGSSKRKWSLTTNCLPI